MLIETSLVRVLFLVHVTALSYLTMLQPDE